MTSRAKQAALMALCSVVGGCGVSRTGGSGPLLALTFLDRYQEIEFYTDGTAEYTIADVTAARRVEQRYRVPCSKERVHYLRSVLYALGSIDNPVPPGQGGAEPTTILTVYRDGRVAALFRLPVSVEWRHPLWRGLRDECIAIASGDLVSGLFYMDVAEEYAKRNDWWFADGEYQRAARSFVAWQKRLWDEAGRSYEDDSCFLLSEPTSLSEAGLHREAALAWQEVCRDLKGSVTVVEQNGWHQITSAEIWPTGLPEPRLSGPDKGKPMLPETNPR